MTLAKGSVLAGKLQLAELLGRGSFGDVWGVVRLGDRKRLAAKILREELIDQDEVVRRFVEVELTRLPIFRETLDDPVGLVHIKDVVKLIAPAASGGSPPWKESVLHRIRRELLYVPASMRTADLLVRMRAQRIHLAVVIDEFGGTDGLVTLEDIIEEVVGEIDDEHDVDEVESKQIVAQPDGRYLVNALTPIAEFNERFDSEFSDEEFDTIGGMVTSEIGHLPEVGEEVTVGGFQFHVTKSDDRRVHQFAVRVAD